MLILTSLLCILFLEVIIKKYFKNSSKIDNKSVFKIISVINYTFYWVISIFCEYMRYFYGDYQYYNYFIPVCAYSLNTMYLYELFYYTPDLAHIIHHLLTIILQSYIIFSSFLDDKLNLVLGVTAYWSMITSSLSSLRYITDKSFKKRINNIYRVSFVVFKLFTISVYYIIFYNRYNFLQLDEYYLIYILYTLIHLVQLYFIFVIIRNCYLKFISYKL